MCFDKTGTLTEDTLDFFGIQPAKIIEGTKKL